MPGTWIERLATARYIASYRLALHILYRHWKGGGEPFTLSNGMVAMEGVGRRAKWRALQELEQLGLITVETAQAQDTADHDPYLNHETWMTMWLVHIGLMIFAIMRPGRPYGV